MTEKVQDPGAPRTDEIARNAVRTAFLHWLDDTLQDNPADYNEAIADALVVQFDAFTWERDVNSHGQPVRRYVLRGPWEVDPEAAQSQAVACPKCGGWNSSRSALAIHLKTTHPETLELHWRQILDRGDEQATRAHMAAWKAGEVNHAGEDHDDD